MRKQSPDPKGYHVPGVPLDKEKIKELIIQYEGNLTAVARAMRCARRSITRIVQTDAEMQEITAEARERLIDEVECSFIKKVKSNTDTAATIFFLKMQARDRGYDQDYKNNTEQMRREAIAFALNKSRNPAEKQEDDVEDEDSTNVDG